MDTKLEFIKRLYLGLPISVESVIRKLDESLAVWNWWCTILLTVCIAYEHQTLESQLRISLQDIIEVGYVKSNAIVFLIAT